jgi:tight adherence protein C
MNLESVNLLVLVGSVFASVSVLCMVGGLYALRTGTNLRDRFETYLPDVNDTPTSLQEIELAQPFAERIILPIVRQAARLFAWLWPANRMQALRLRLVQAGLDSISASDFLGVKGLLMLLIVGLAVLIGWATAYPFDYYAAIMLVGLAIGSFSLPDIWLSRKVSQRQQNLVLQLPDALDLLVIVIEGGLSFESALQEIVDKSHGQLAREFGRVLADMNIGKARRQALNDLATRTGVPDIVAFVTAVNQAEELGVGLGRVLNIQAEELRLRRQQRAQERANQAPIKMMFPIVFLIFPSIFAVLLGPAIPQLLDMFTRAGG